MIEVVRNKDGITVYRSVEREKKSRSENCEQVDLNFHCAELWPIEYGSMWHTVNESGRSGNAQYGAELNKRGRKKGVSDWIVAVPKNGFHGLFIELKKEGKDASPISKEQRDFLLCQQQLDYKCVVAYGYKAALKAIDNYLLTGLVE